MTTLIKLFYAGAICTLLILLVAFAIRTFYGPPKAPEYPQPAAGLRPITPVPPPGVAPLPPPEQQAFDEAQQRYQDDYKRYEEKRSRYHRNVFLVAALAGVVSLAGGLMLPPHLDAIRLGLVAGGLGTLLYAVIQAAEDLNDFGPEIGFAVALIGLGAVLAAGYRWLARAPDAA